jgi:hypothetical protein
VPESSGESKDSPTTRGDVAPETAVSVLPAGADLRVCVVEAGSEQRRQPICLPVQLRLEGNLLIPCLPMQLQLVESAPERLNRSSVTAQDLSHHNLPSRGDFRDGKLD